MNARVGGKITGPIAVGLAILATILGIGAGDAGLGFLTGFSIVLAYDCSGPEFVYYHGGEVPRPPHDAVGPIPI